MNTPASDASRRAGRPRSPEADAAILSAALELLGEGGFERLTMEAIAARAGVSKPTLYRRYHSPTEVAIALIDVLDASAVPIPDTGSLREDLLEVAKGLVRLLKRSPFGAFVPSLVGAAGTHPEFALAVRAYLRRRRRQVEQVIVRGIERGELPSDTDPHHVLDLLLGPFYFRHLISNDPIDNRFAARVCDSVLAAAGARSPAEKKEKTAR